jgi:hypothetical protein
MCHCSALDVLIVRHLIGQRNTRVLGPCGSLKLEYSDESAPSDHEWRLKALSSQPVADSYAPMATQNANLVRYFSHRSSTEGMAPPDFRSVTFVAGVTE